MSACGIHHVAERSAAPPPSADAEQATQNCFEAATPLDRAICGAPALAGPNAAMLRAYHDALGSSGLFARDAMLASQTAWKLGLAARCGVTGSPTPAALACLGAALAERGRALAAWRPGPASAGAIAAYVTFRRLPGTVPRDAALCEAVARGANAALARSGTADPGLWGAREIVGTHGAAAAPGGDLAVAIYDGNVYALYQRRARALGGRGREVIGSQTLTEEVQRQSRANAGGRFTDFASQTGDYGALDVFRMGNRLLVLAADAWGSTAPAAPGEFAHAGLWELAGEAADPVCLYDTYQMPGEDAGFGALPGLAAWRASLAALRAGTAPPLGPADLRDRSVLGADSDFVVLNMPLLAIGTARAGGWTNWLRLRHDAVLDALFAWSTASPENKALFRSLFAQMKPAARDLVHGFQRIDGLRAREAEDAAAVAVMELLYNAAAGIAPASGADLLAPASAGQATPRYPILAEPQ